MISLLSSYSHTSLVLAACPPCPACSAPSGRLRATSHLSDQPPCPPCPPSHPSPRLTLPSTGSLRGPTGPSSTPASTRSGPTWTWTYGTLRPTAAPTRSCPMTPATAEMFKKKEEKTKWQTLKNTIKVNVLLSILGENVNIPLLLGSNFQKLNVMRGSAFVLYFSRCFAVLIKKKELKKGFVLKKKWFSWKLHNTFFYLNSRFVLQHSLEIERFEPCKPALKLISWTLFLKLPASTWSYTVVSIYFPANKS